MTEEQELKKYKVKIMIEVDVEAIDAERAVGKAEETILSDPKSADWDHWSTFDEEGIEYDLNGSVIGHPEEDSNSDSL